MKLCPDFALIGESFRHSIAKKHPCLTHSQLFAGSVSWPKSHMQQRYKWAEIDYDQAHFTTSLQELTVSELSLQAMPMVAPSYLKL